MSAEWKGYGDAVGLLKRLQAALEAFQQGASMEDACRVNAIEQHQLEDMLRLKFELSAEELAAAIALELGRATPFEIQRIADWLRSTMIWIIEPDADLLAEARANVDFSNGIEKKMDIPVIAIARHKIGFYEWALEYGGEHVDGEVGYSSISACLSSAVAAIPDDFKMVEIRYRTVGIGTFPRVALEEVPDVIAEQVANDYGTLFE